MLPVVILCGGYGSRLAPLTDTLPKSLVDINGEPFLYHQLALLAQQQVTDVHLCTGYLGNQIEVSVHKWLFPTMKITCWSDGEQPIGTANAVRQINLTSAFFLLYGDVYPLCGFSNVQSLFERYSFPGLMTIFPVRVGRGNVQYEAGLCRSYNKFATKARMPYQDYGLGILQPSVLQQETSSDIADVYASLNNQMLGYVMWDIPLEIGSFDGLERTRTFLRTRSHLLQ